MNQPILPADSLIDEKRELQTILSRPEIARSANLVRMLSFVCKKYFEGRIEEIRESNIAIHALGRRESDFDSNSDPIVRVTARTLRKRLDAFYQGDGQSRPLRLVLPVGRYVPQFVRLEDAAPLQGDDPSKRRALRANLSLVTVFILACTVAFWAGRRTAPVRSSAAMEHVYPDKRPQAVTTPLRTREPQALY
jgi:hypothetical protein